MMAGNKLTKICDDKREHVDKQKQFVSEQQLLQCVKASSPVRGFHDALQYKIAVGGIGLIAEIKKASPSKGLIREDFRPTEIARAYEAAGAACLSVLTDEPYFQGEDSYLQAARAVVELPVLRKDFMIDSYQIIESRVLGADCILLIMAALSDAQAKELESLAFELGMDVLVEIHNKTELDRALKLESKLIGINNRDLKSLKVDLSTAENLCKDIPKEYTIVCESGIASKQDVTRMQKAGISAFLIGEHFMRQDDIKAAVEELIAK